MPSESDFFFTLKKCQAKLVSVRLNEMKFRARTLYKTNETILCQPQFLKNILISLIYPKCMTYLFGKKIRVLTFFKIIITSI